MGANLGWRKYWLRRLRVPVWGEWKITRSRAANPTVKYHPWCNSSMAIYQYWIFKRQRSRRETSCYFTLLRCSSLFSSLLCSALLLCSAVLCSALLSSTLLYYTLLGSTLLCSTLPGSTLLYLYSTRLYFSLLYWILLFSDLYSILDSNSSLLYTHLYSTLPLLCATPVQADWIWDFWATSFPTSGQSNLT